MESIKVMFRKCKDNGEIVAVFPYEIADFNNNVTCYAHIGQHGACSYEWVLTETRAAKTEEYHDLAVELRNQGYDNLKIIKKKMKGK